MIQYIVADVSLGMSMYFWFGYLFIAIIIALAIQGSLFNDE